LTCDREDWNTTNNQDTLVFIATNQETTGIPGDINNDGEVNTKDLVRLMKKISAGVTDADLDLNGDGSVDNADLRQLMKYLADPESVVLH
jgi:hypothetical protein